MNKRRKLVIALGACALAAPLGLFAQPQGKVWRIGFLGNSSPELEANLVGPFREGLRELGYVEGQTSSSSIGGRRGSTSGLRPSSPNCWPGKWR